MAKGYIVEIVTKRGLSQKYHVRIKSAGNSKILFTSEKLANQGYARALAKEIATALNTGVKDATS